jgi:hypothetical protein
MKKLLIKLANGLLSRDQMRSIKGGEDYADCCVTCESGNNICITDCYGQCQVSGSYGTVRCTNPDMYIECYV